MTRFQFRLQAAGEVHRLSSHARKRLGSVTLFPFFRQRQGGPLRPIAGNKREKALTKAVFETAPHPTSNCVVPQLDIADQLSGVTYYRRPRRTKRRGFLALGAAFRRCLWFARLPHHCFSARCSDLYPVDDWRQKDFRGGREGSP